MERGQRDGRVLEESRAEECYQIYRWVVGHDGPGLHLDCSILQEEKNTHELRGREQTTIPSSSISVFLLGSC
jgi:hypothetical protein